MGFYFAAALPSASHQKVRQEYVMTSLPALRNIEKGNVKISFFTCVKWPKGNILQRSSNAGYYKVSSPALTFADQRYLGGSNSVCRSLDFNPLN